MSRAIEFRGLAKTGEFIYGFYVQDAFDGTSINVTHGIQKAGCYPVEIDPKTLGQFTGLLDRNGVKIFEGDIVKPLCGGSCGAFNCAVIVFDSAAFSAFANEKHFVFHGINCVKHQVIGNIHQNSELLK